MYLVIDQVNQPTNPFSNARPTKHQQQVMENPFFVGHGMRLATCLQLLDATDEMQSHFEGTNMTDHLAPFWFCSCFWILRSSICL